MGFNPQESLENTINTMGTRTLGVHVPLVPWWVSCPRSLDIYVLCLEVPHDSNRCRWVDWWLQVDSPAEQNLTISPWATKKKSPGDSMWPFYVPVGGHLTFKKGHLTIPKRSLWIARLLFSMKYWLFNSGILISWTHGLWNNPHITG